MICVSYDSQRDLEKITRTEQHHIPPTCPCTAQRASLPGGGQCYRSGGGGYTILSRFVGDPYSTPNNADSVKSVIQYRISMTAVGGCFIRRSVDSESTFCPSKHLHARTINTTLSAQRRGCSVLVAAMVTLRPVDAAAQLTISLQFHHLHRATFHYYFASKLLYPAKSIYQAISNKVLQLHLSSAETTKTPRLYRRY